MNSSHLVISYAVFCLQNTYELKSPCLLSLLDVSSLLVVDISVLSCVLFFFFFFFNDTATPEISPFSLPDALPIWTGTGKLRKRPPAGERAAGKCSAG